MTALAVVRLPRVPARSTGAYTLTTPTGADVARVAVAAGGRSLDVTAVDGAPLGRLVATSTHGWDLFAPYVVVPLAQWETGRHVTVRIGPGPAATVRGRGDTWDLVREQTRLLAVRRTPRAAARGLLDVWVEDPACTPAVVAAVVHVQRFWQAVQSESQQLLHQQANAVVPPGY